MFDITAPLERQRTRDGRKVLAIFDSKLDFGYPIAYWAEGYQTPFSATNSGRYIRDNSESVNDIITIPELKPLFISYCRVFDDYSGLSDDRDFEDAKESVDGCFGIIKITFDPNTGASTSETIWTQDEK